MFNLFAQVDLTLSDSDDDLPLAKRRPIAKQTTQAGAASSTMNGNGGGNNQRGMYMPQKNGTLDSFSY